MDKKCKLVQRKSTMDQEWCSHCIRFCTPIIECDSPYTSRACPNCGKILGDNASLKVERLRRTWLVQKACNMKQRGSVNLDKLLHFDSKLKHF